MAAAIAAIGIWLRPAPSTDHSILVAEQPVGGALHVQHVFRMRADAALQAEHGLDEQRRLHQALLEEVVEVVEMRGVVALELEARAGLRQRLQHVFDVLEGVAEHDVLVLRDACAPSRA